jgi:hypothetical protein
METVVYYYRIAGSGAPDVEMPSAWQVAGPFPGADSFDGFRKAEFVEGLAPGAWPDELKSGDEAFAVRTMKTHHGWIDLQEPFYKVVGHSAYARTSIESAKSRDAILRIAADDWCTVRLNGEHVATLRHEKGLETARLPVKLKKGANELLLKNNNTNVPPNRLLWVINCAIE